MEAEKFTQYRDIDCFSQNFDRGVPEADIPLGRKLQKSAIAESPGRKTPLGQRMKPPGLNNLSGNLQ